jgi:hypothetical protein
VSSQGRTLYALSPETAKHLLCTSSSCLKFWPPLTVASHDTSLEAGMGVKGHFGILRRSNGMLQVTYAGMPLYRFAGDRAKGEANGEGLHSFGGTPRGDRSPTLRSRSLEPARSTLRPAASACGRHRLPACRGSDALR